MIYNCKMSIIRILLWTTNSAI